MFVFVLTVLIAIAGVLAIVFPGLLKSKPGTIRGVGIAAVVLAFLLFAVSGLKSVPVKNIGVPQAFGAVTGSAFGPGIHETWQPWLHLTDVDETVQTITFEGCHGPYCAIPGEQQGNCLEVRIGGQQTACADITIQVRIRPSAADGLFNDYANQGDLMTTIKDAVVVRELRQVVNQVLGDYNPITDQQALASNSNATSQFSTFASAVETQMRLDIGNRIEVQNLLMPLLRYDSTTQKRLNAIQQAYADDAIAKEQRQVSLDQAAAYRNLGTPSVNALVSQCLSDLKNLVGQLPAGFQCFPGANSGLALSGK
jgi:hypothetical protein